MICFADDTNLIILGTNPNKLIKKANIELQKINDYLTANKLIINTKKIIIHIVQASKKKGRNSRKITNRKYRINQVQNSKILKNNYRWAFTI